ncbi:MAG: succinate dehydrogenase cytochrome b subunit [Saprospiraceae bacterium]
MNWILNFLKSSLGKKIIMSLTGLFLCLFLVIHLLGNLQLLKQDGGKAFNIYAYVMTHNPIIKIISWINYFFILFHAIQGLVLYFQNKSARKFDYDKKHNSKTSFGARNMAILGTLILAFILIHMGDFWLKMKREVLVWVNYEGYDHVQDLYSRVSIAYDQWWIVLFYVFSIGVLYYHLSHGFQSAFQTLGINHPRYTPIIKGFGKWYSILICLGFAIIPIIHFFFYK